MAFKRREISLPDEETEMILVRLPATDLACFKLVCKRWRSLISSPGFISAHLSRSKSDPSSHDIIVQDDLDYYIESPPGPFESFIYCYCQSMLIVGSINGLICAVGNYLGQFSANDIWILNPVTRLSKKLPPSKCPIIEPPTCRAAFAFWWDSSTDDYKVVKIVFFSDDTTTLAEVWVSSSPDTWSDITVSFRCPYYHPTRNWVDGCDVLVEGFGAYWIFFDKNNQDLFVASLDLTTLTFEKISLPQLSSSPESLIKHLNNMDDSSFFATNWRGSFALVERDFGASRKTIHNVWVLDRGGSEACWKKDFSFDADLPFGSCFNCVNGKLVLARGPSGRGLALFDMETLKYEVLEGVRDVASAHDFVGSFVSIQGFKRSEDWFSSNFTVRWPYNHAASGRGEFRKTNEVIKEHSEEEKEKQAKEEICGAWPSKEEMDLEVSNLQKGYKQMQIAEMEQICGWPSECAWPSKEEMDLEVSNLQKGYIQILMKRTELWETMLEQQIMGIDLSDQKWSDTQRQYYMKRQAEIYRKRCVV